MLVVCWISVFCFLRSGSAQNHHTRHERTRYVSGRNQIYGSGLVHGQNYIPFVHYWERPLQILESSMNVPKKLSSRPLFSWDLPVQVSTYTSTKKLPTLSTTTTPTTTTTTTTTTTAAENSNQLLKDTPILSPLSKKQIDNDVFLSKTLLKTRSDRLNRAKDSILYEGPYDYKPKKKKSNNRKKSIEETHGPIRWRQSDARSPGKLGSEFDSKQVKRKRKGKKSKKGKMNGKRVKPFDKIKNELNDGVNEVNPKNPRMLTEADFIDERMKINNVVQGRRYKIAYPGKERGGGGGEEKEERIESLCEVMKGKCEHMCQEEENGKGSCVCYKGYTPVGNRCVDINECEANNGGCNGKCINTIGSRKCVCSKGFRLVDGVCADVNECFLRNGHGPCQDRCTNTFGSYACSCEGLPGTSLSSDRHTCEEDNECNSNAAGCSHSCISTSGIAFCTCPNGMELGDDWKTCHDIDECSNPEDYSVECPSGCVNTVGSYTCATDNSTTKEEEEEEEENPPLT